MSLEIRLRLSVIHGELLKLATETAAADAKIIHYAARVLAMLR